MYFAEIDLKANQSRHFNISVNGEPWHGTVTPEYLRATIAYTNSPIGPFTGGNFTFSFYPVQDSTLLPILNAVEAYYVIYFLQSETEQEDIDPIKKIKARYGISTRNWQGDPCAPQDYVWNGLICSYNGTALPTITSLNLSSNGLTGEIALDIANLKSLMYLASGNPGLCLSDSCNNTKKKKKLVVSVAASVSSLFAIVILLAIIFRVKLLLRVHHRNLTSLIGYCNENDKIGLIYEYMANGNLKDHLSGGNPNILSWKLRLQIALEAAQGYVLA
ncbi:hypothetical protein GH714_019899 [Hevea brasiliensis]|uniref:Malectin-like domain-containing protein n=1 Tax=Hevea brasiliensis TaxID=3981 RepID=A0A6A6LLS1_HEVBR|nr:hypothetical protein GH714_019899 [Hevea brasiliensis]